MKNWPVVVSLIVVIVLGAGTIRIDSAAAALGGQPGLVSSITCARMSSLLGEWTNIDNETHSLTHLSISRTRGTWTIRAWGSCHPTDCDWGRVTLWTFGDSVTDNSPKYGVAHWNAGFKETRLTLRVNGEELVVETNTCFDDNSGRANYRSVERLRRLRVRQTQWIEYLPPHIAPVLTDSYRLENTASK
ncbi:MAG: hypothetical protein PCFJNLEI_01636 [Verrucomicrobiae bacterium]|nr:hypothetical protein [Verrucomicrobiae bacterium]